MTQLATTISDTTQYASLLAEVRQRIGRAQTRALLAVNSELIQLYWSIGQLIDGRQKMQGWGAGIIPQLANDIRNEAPTIKGFSARNIDLMVQFYREYPSLMDKSTISQTPFAKLPWSHNLLLVQKVKDLTIRQWYAQAVLDNGWTHSVLLAQIQSQAHTRQGALISNFASTLPAAQSDLVQQAFKDPYIFDFLTLTDIFTERELEVGLVKHLEQFLIELGRGFAFVGRQYHLDIGERDFYIDLLFYHLELRCFVVIELKRGEFKPEYAGKMNFYCSAVDDTLKKPNDAPTIGLILCQEPNRIVAEYALRGVAQAIGVSTFELTRALPSNLQPSLPSIEQIEQEMKDWAQ
jgi:predicted nuclease of restriction endonuclease-like (RecB) superfamily